MSERVGSPRGRSRARLPFAGALVVALAAAAAAQPATAAAAPDRAEVASASSVEAPTVTLFPAALPRGADTPLLHMEEEVIVDGALRVPVAGPTPMWLMGRIGRDYLVTASSADFEHYVVRLVRPNGESRVLQRFGQRTAVTMSADGRHLALATMVRPDTRIRVVRTRSGELVRERLFASYGAEVSDYGQRRLVITGLRSRTFWWDPVRDRLRLIVAHPAGADIAADRLVVMVPRPKRPYLFCQQTVRLSEPSDVLWRSCRYIPLAFSPQRGRIAAVDIQSDGIGPWEVQLRRARGKLVQTYRAPMWFGFVEWESERGLFLQPVGRHFLAAVRCDIGGGCERASRLYDAPGTFDPPETMRWSFPQ